MTANSTQDATEGRVESAAGIGETKPAFRIDNEQAANWYVRKIANIESEKARVTMQAAQIVRQLETDAEGLRGLHEADLQEWTRQELAKKGNRRKSLVLLQGTAQFRTVPAGVKISDANAALAYAVSSLPEAVGTRPTLDMEKYRKAAQNALQNGELLPGIEKTPEREAFSVKFGKTE